MYHAELEQGDRAAKRICEGKTVVEKKRAYYWNTSYGRDHMIVKSVFIGSHSHEDRSLMKKGLRHWPQSGSFSRFPEMKIDP